MRLFDIIPERFFSILSSGNKEIYVQALLVLRQAFKTELVIRREDLAAMLMDALEADLQEADFSEEASLEGASGEESAQFSGKAYLLLRRLKETGWIETEYEPRTFEEHITIPDYAVLVMNLLYDLSSERIREYNSYVYATYAALENAAQTPDYTFQALQTAYQNTVRLIDELKSLFNNIRRYYRRIPGEDDVNTLLAEHFDEYKAKVVDTVYYPLKTIDSVPRFKHAIIAKLNAWLLDEGLQDLIVSQGISRRVFEDEEEGRDRMFQMINYIADTYEGIEEMIGEIDRKHTEYINASVEHIRYLMNSDRGVRGNLIELLKHADDPELLEKMTDSIQVQRHQFFDEKSLYAEAKRTKRNFGKPMAIQEREQPEEAVSGFLSDVRRQYTNRKIDSWVNDCFGERTEFSTEEVLLSGPEDFICFLLGTIRGREKSAGYTVTFLEEDIEHAGYRLPRVIFRRK